MTNDKIAMDLIKEWQDGNYSSATQKGATLQCMIIAALENAQIEAEKAVIADQKAAIDALSGRLREMNMKEDVMVTLGMINRNQLAEVVQFIRKMEKTK